MVQESTQELRIIYEVIKLLEGADKKNSYDKFWLVPDMENMAYFFEYAPKLAMMLYNTDNLDRVTFLSAFMTSRFRRMMEEGHPRFLSQAAIDSFKMYVDVDFDGDLSRFVKVNQPQYAPNQWFWIGEMYAYVHYMADMHSTDIIRKLPIPYMLQQYSCGHTMSYEQYFEKLANRLK